MQASVVERLEKDFMITRLTKILVASLILLSCEPNLVDDPIPFAAFDDIVINLSFPDYIALNQDGGSKAINDQNAGVRGIIVYRNSAASYFAFERNCSYHPNEACATVEVHSSGLFLIDPCCTSSFDFANGQPTGGPAWRPLRQYRTQLNGTILTITDEVLD